MIKQGTALEEFTLASSYFWELTSSGFRVGPNDKVSDGVTDSSFYTNDT